MPQPAGVTALAGHGTLGPPDPVAHLLLLQLCRSGPDDAGELIAGGGVRQRAREGVQDNLVFVAQRRQFQPERHVTGQPVQVPHHQVGDPAGLDVGDQLTAALALGEGHVTADGDRFLIERQVRQTGPFDVVADVGLLGRCGQAPLQRLVAGQPDVAGGDAVTVGDGDRRRPVLVVQAGLELCCCDAHARSRLKPAVGPVPRRGRSDPGPKPDYWKRPLGRT